MSINQPRQSNNPEVPTLEGHSLPLGRFGVEELWGELNAAAIRRVLTGEGAVCHVHGLFSPETCQGIRNNFWGNPGIAKRGDNVPGFHVGGYHYGKTTEQYLDECELKRPYVRALFNNVGNPVEAFRVVLAKVAADSGRSLRAASHGGRLAGECNAQSWRAAGEFMLDPHDDMAQIGTLEQQNFEIQDVRRHVPVAVNLYVSMPEVGGEVEIWNICPNDDCRRRLGIEHRGHPYPPESLRGHNSILLRVRQGDCVFFAGGLVHAVRGAGVPDDDSLGEARINITFFTGIKDDETIIWWT